MQVYIFHNFSIFNFRHVLENFLINYIFKSVHMGISTYVKELEEKTQVDEH